MDLMEDCSLARRGARLLHEADVEIAGRVGPTFPDEART
jgi:hypothetical protein